MIPAWILLTVAFIVVAVGSIFSSNLGILGLPAFVAALATLASVLLVAEARQSAIIAVPVVIACVILVAESKRAVLYAGVLCACALLAVVYLYLLPGAWGVSVVMSAGVALLPVAWAVARNRTFAAAWMSYAVAIVLLLGILASGIASDRRFEFRYNVEGTFGHAMFSGFQWPIAGVVLVITAWFAAWLSPRASMAFIPQPDEPSDRAAVASPAIVGHTASGEPVWANQIAAPASERTNTYAIVALVLGFVGGILAIPFGHVALSQIKRTGEQGRGMAIAGLVLGYLSLIAYVVVAIAFAVMWSSIN